MIERTPDASVWRLLYNDLRERILSGDLAGGSPMPSEQDMIRLYGHGASTIRRVMGALRREGLVEGHAGDVARVRTMPERRIVEVRSADNPAIVVRRPTAAERYRLGLAEGEQVIEVTYGGMSDLYGADRTEIRVVP